MFTAWISECAGWFGACYLWKIVDCTGEGSIMIDNTRDLCHDPGYIVKAIQCFGD